MRHRVNLTQLKIQLGRMVQESQNATFLANQIDQALDMAHEDIRRIGKWRKLKRSTPWSLTTVAAYEDGTVTATLDSTTVTGSGTTFTAAMVGRKFHLMGDYRSYVVAAFVSASEITLDEAYENDDLDGASKTYVIYQDVYNLDQDFNIIEKVRHSKGKMGRENLSDYFADNPTTEGINDPNRYDIIEEGVTNQPVSVSAIRLQSSDSADTSKVVLIRGLVGGVEDFEEVTLDSNDGTTPVSSTKSFSRVDKIMKDTEFVGILTADSNSATVTVHTIPPEFLEVTVKKLQVYYWPKNKIRIFVTGWRYPHPLIRGYDTPDVAYDLYLAAGLVNVLRMAGSWKKAAQQIRWFTAKAQQERIAEEEGVDETLEIVQNASYYKLDSPSTY